MFALELRVEHAFRPVFDMTSLDPGTYASNPALKVPVLVDEQGSLFGAENICRELARRSSTRTGVVLRGDSPSRIVANCEEQVLHAMSAEVSLVMVGVAETKPPPKLRPSLENSLGFLEQRQDELISALPPDRAVSFVEVALFCLVTHLPWRKVLDVAPWPRLQAFGERYGQRESAQATAYRFDQP
jgi:glutathione S-transferase